MSRFGDVFFELGLLQGFTRTNSDTAKGGAIRCATVQLCFASSPAMKPRVSPLRAAITIALGLRPLNSNGVRGARSPFRLRGPAAPAMCGRRLQGHAFAAVVDGCRQLGAATVLARIKRARVDTAEGMPSTTRLETL